MKVMETMANIQHNKLMHLEDSMVMYDIYNAETLKKIHRHGERNFKFSKNND